MQIRLSARINRLWSTEKHIDKTLLMTCRQRFCLSAWALQLIGDFYFHMTFDLRVWWTSPAYINSFLSAAYMRRWIGTALLQVKACRLFDAKPSPERMLTYCRFDPREQTSVKFDSKCNVSSAIWWSFCPEGEELTALPVSAKFEKI